MDKDGKNLKEVVDGKKQTVYDEVDRQIKKDNPSRLNAKGRCLHIFIPLPAFQRCRRQKEEHKEN